MRPAPLLASALLAAAAVSGCSRTAPVEEPVRAVRTVTVSSQTAGGTYEYAGEVRARTESRLSFRVGGKMLQRLADVGDSVRKGQVLARLDPQDLRLGQDASRAQVAAAQASYDQTVADFQRYRELNAQGFIGPAELERRDMSRKTAQAQLDQARAQASVQGNQARYANLVADASGVVTGVDLEPGMVAAPGTPVLRLAHDGPRDVVFSVPEDRVSLVKSIAGQPGRLSVRLWGATDADLGAVVREVAASADPQSRTFLVRADIGELGPDRVRLGQTATVLLELPTRNGVIKLPLSALREERGRTAVWVLDAGSMTLKSQPVVLGGADGNDAVIASGLADGQEVVSAGVHVLSEGQRVTRYVEPGAAAPLRSSSAPSTVDVR